MKFLLLLAFALCALSSFAATPEINKLLLELNHSGNFSFSLRGLDSVHLHFEGDSPRIPASIQKVVPSFLALKEFGPSHRFTTKLVQDGSQLDSVFYGNFILTGGGDPAFGSSYFGRRHKAESLFKSITQKLKQKGIRRIRGCILADESLLPYREASRGAQWEDVGNYYAGVVSALSFADNMAALKLKKNSRPGSPLEILSITPEHSGLNHIIPLPGEALHGKKGTSDEAYLFGSALAELRWIRGSYPAGRKHPRIRASLPFPAWTAAAELKSYLQKKGFTVEGITPLDRQNPGRSAARCLLKQSQKMPPRPGFAQADSMAGKVLWQHEGPSLAELVRHINHLSDNNYTEVIAAHLSRTASKEADEATEAGAPASHAEDILTEKFIKQTGGNLVGPLKSRFHDACGLSRSNYLSASELTAFLSSFTKEADSLKTPALASLWYQGPEKALSHLYPSKKMELWFKTGSMSGIQSLAGYVMYRSGEQKGKIFSFAFMLNHSSWKSRQFRKHAVQFLDRVASLPSRFFLSQQSLDLKAISSSQAQAASKNH